MTTTIPGAQEGDQPKMRWPMLHRVRAGALALAVCLGLAACGGGGGGGTGSTGGVGGVTSAQLRVGILNVNVKDTFGAPVQGALITGPRSTVPTDAQGVARLNVDSAGGNVSLTVSRETFIDQTIVASVPAGAGTEVAVTLLRLTSAAGGSLASRSGFIPVVDAGKQLMTFEIELVLVDGNSNPITNLNQASFSLRACTPDAANQKLDCIRGANDAADLPYAPTVAGPLSVQLIAANPVDPYAAALLMDQSGSIHQSDPSGARLFAAKMFLGALGPNDRALLSAFAGNPGALITPSPLAIYESFMDRNSANIYFPTLDALAKLVGGNTPLYNSLDQLRDTIVKDASLPATIAKAVVIFTDGADTGCADVTACKIRRQLSIDAANTNNVRLFTVGLSTGVDVAALGELANQTGGAFLYADTAEQLLPLYGSVGKLLSLGLPTYRVQWTVQATSAAFQPGSTMLGRVQVTSGTKTFDVPFVVGIP